MPDEPKPEPPVSGVIAHLRRALAHAQEALLCFVALILGQVERRVAAVIHQAVWAFLAAGTALLGVILLACGFAAFLDSRLGVPGAGPMIIGGALLAVALAFVLFQAGRKRK